MATPNRPGPRQPTRGASPPQQRPVQRAAAPQRPAQRPPQQQPPQRRPSTGFVYQPSNPDYIKKASTRKGGTFDPLFLPEFDTYAPAEGDNCVRFLPQTWEGAEHFGLIIHSHNYIGLDKQSYLCLRKMLHQPCPVCEAYEEARNREEEDEDLVKSLRPQERNIYWVLNRDARNELAYKPLIWNASWTQDRDICGLIRDPRTSEILQVANPDFGYDLRFTRIGKMLNTRYSAWNFAREETPIADDRNVQDDILDYIVSHPLPDTLLYFDYDHIALSLYGATEDTGQQQQHGRVAGTRQVEETQDAYEEQPPFDNGEGEVQTENYDPNATDQYEEGAEQTYTGEDPGYVEGETQEYEGEAEVAEEPTPPPAARQRAAGGRINEGGANQGVRQAPPQQRPAQRAAPQQAQPRPVSRPAPAAQRPVQRPAAPPRTQPRR